MKKTIKLIGFSMVAGAVALTLSLASCEKDQVVSPSATVGKEQTSVKNGKENNPGVEKTDPNTGPSVVVSGSCKEIKCNTMSTDYSTTFNMISFTKTGHNSPPYNLRYKVYMYDYTSGNVKYYNAVSGIDFICSNTTTSFAGPELENYKSYYLVVSAPGASLPTVMTHNTSTNLFNIGTSEAFPFSTHKAKGRPCVGPVIEL